MKLHIAEIQDFSPDVITLLNKRFEVSTGIVEKSTLKQKLCEVDIFWFRLGYQITEKVIDNQTRCRYLVSPVTGIDHIDEKLCAKQGIQIICLRGEKEFLKEVRATAEHTILLAMMLMRNVVAAVDDTKNGNWRRDLFRGFELYKKKVGIIGYGRLGAIVSDYFHALGCEVGYFDIKDKQHPEYIRRFRTLEDCIQNSDLISIHVPYNQSTYHLLNKEILTLFNENKWLINTSRGGIVDDKALLGILKNKKIAGAALDVLYGEPNISDNPLIMFAKENRNVIITPHIGGCTYESFEKTEKFIAEKLLKTIAYQTT